jgi:hypothetical protein
MALLATLIILSGALVSAVDVSTVGTIPALFDFEKIQLHSEGFQLDDPRAKLLPENRECKVFPGDADWPSGEAWTIFNATLNGALLKPAPLASVCYNNTAYNNFAGSECESLSSKWQSGGGIERYNFKTMA